jgi:hypothetical protein
MMHSRTTQALHRGNERHPRVFLIAGDCRRRSSPLRRRRNDHDGIGGCPFEIGFDEVMTAACRSLGNRDIPLLRPSFQPALKLLGNVPQHEPAHRAKLPVGVEEAGDAFRLLERLNQPVQQDAIKAPLPPSNAVPVMFVERVHERPPADHRQPDSAAHSSPSRKPSDKGISRAKPLAS